jgi:hypothetical protein
MDEKELKNNIPCIIDNGIIYNPKDIQKILRDLGQVNYSYIINNESKGSGEGYIVSVVANNSSANIIVNKRIYLNVNGFEYMQIKNEENQSIIELITQDSILRFLPINSSIEDNQNNEIILTHPSELTDDELDEAFAEINFDDDFDDE